MFLTLCILRAALGAVDLGKVTLKGIPSCADWCKSAGHGEHGEIIGTQPWCAGLCSRDCPNTYCQLASKDEFSDYGGGCIVGNKICCCSASTGADLAKDKLMERLPKNETQ